MQHQGVREDFASLQNKIMIESVGLLPLWHLLYAIASRTSQKKPCFNRSEEIAKMLNSAYIDLCVELILILYFVFPGYVHGTGLQFFWNESILTWENTGTFI